MLFNQASTKFYIMEWILKYCMYWPDTLQKAPTDTHIYIYFFFLSIVVCSSQCFVKFCFMMPLFISATRNYPENVLKPKSCSCTRFMYGTLMEGTLHRKFSTSSWGKLLILMHLNTPNTNKSCSNLFFSSFLLQLLYIQPHISKDLEWSLKIKMFMNSQ